MRKCCRIFGFDFLSRQFISKAFEFEPNIGVKLDGAVNIINCKYATGKGSKEEVWAVVVLFYVKTTCKISAEM